MIRLPRWFLGIVITMFVLSPAVIGLIELFRVGFRLSSAVALVIYLVVGLSTVFDLRELKMPLTLAIAVTASSLAIPQLVNLNLEPSELGTPATWYVTAVATILGVTAVRQRRLWVLIGIIILTIEVLAWGGIQALFVSGLGGAYGLVGAAYAISVGLERSAKQTASYLERSKATQAASAVDSAVRQERSERIASTLEGALPMLELIAKGELSESDRKQAALLEAELRDEIRGRMLVNPILKASVRAARARGVEVVVLDEGGLVRVSEQDRESLRNQVAAELDKIGSGRVTIRSPQGTNIRVTFVASRKGTAKPDVFLRL